MFPNEILVKNNDVDSTISVKKDNTLLNIGIKKVIHVKGKIMN